MGKIAISHFDTTSCLTKQMVAILNLMVCVKPEKVDGHTIQIVSLILQSMMIELEKELDIMCKENADEGKKEGLQF